MSRLPYARSIQNFSSMKTQTATDQPKSSTTKSHREETATEWIATTQIAQWQRMDGLTISPAGDIESSASDTKWDVEVQLEMPLQEVDGFGVCFNELGWTSLSTLRNEDKEGIFQELFAPGVGANFSLCRTSIGGNDFSRDWYSYDEVPGDFALEHFSIANDLETTIPFIKNALKYQPELKLWASPWSPPTWMKYNKHYAAAIPGPDMPPNGLRPDQVGKEGTDMFIQEDRYLRAYAAYIVRFIEAYRSHGINIGMVMPQNEFNSAQVFPSCCWTPEGLARFIAFLGPELEKLNVDLFFGTMERPNERLVDLPLQDPRSGPYIKGAGFQWAGKRAIPGIHRRYPNLKLYQTEQQCGDSKNDWRFCRYAWTLLKHFFENGVSAYCYWNTSLAEGGVGRWGWAQNSLVTVDTKARAFKYNYEYYLMKHLSGFVRPGARRLQIMSWSGYENLLAFSNPDNSVVIVVQNDLCEDLPIRVKVGQKLITANLAADSFNTFLVTK
jgi:glucosylceramidase